MKRFSALPLICSVVANTAFCSETLTDALTNQVEANRASVAAQQSIERLDETTRRMAEEYRETLRQGESLQVFNAHLRQLVDSQEATKQSLETQIGNLELTRREIVPLMLRMLDALDRFVQLDKPFLSEDRSRRIQDLKELMTRADVGDAEKFHRLLEAYQSESEYGRTLETYRGELKSDGNPRTVNFLRIGRLALIYQTLDEKKVGYWSERAKAWQTLPADYASPLAKALAVARKASPPDLLTIPVELSEAGR